MSARKHPNSKFTRGSLAYKLRQCVLAAIMQRTYRGQRFDDLQGLTLQQQAQMFGRQLRELDAASLAEARQ